jgi:hypothetical protein
VIGNFISPVGWRHPAREVAPMAEPQTKQQTYSWVVCRRRGTPAQFIGPIYDQPDEQAAIKQAIEELKVREPA